MARPVVFRRGVGRDLAKVYRWYEEQRSGLGEEFVAAVAFGLARPCSQFSSVRTLVRR